MAYGALVVKERNPIAQFGLGATLILSACGKYELAEFKSIRADYDEYTVDFGNRKVDVLFVVDSSGSMEDQQATLASSMPKFIANFAGKTIDYHIGVITTDVDINQNQYFPSSSSVDRQPFGDVFLWDGAGSLLSSRRGSTLGAGEGTKPAHFLSKGMSVNLIEEKFSLSAQPGTNGSGAEAPLLALAHFLMPERLDGWNRDFLRADSLFSVVFVTDEDESLTSCSATSLDHFNRSSACLEAGINSASFVNRIPDAKSSRLELFNNAFLAQRVDRPSLLSVDAVVARGECGGTGSVFGQVIKAHGELLAEIAETYSEDQKGGKVHDLCVGDFSESIGAIGNTLANSVERIFVLKSDRVQASTIQVEVNGALLGEGQYRYDARKNRVIIDDFGLDHTGMNGVVRIRVYYDKKISIES